MQVHVQLFCRNPGQDSIHVYFLRDTLTPDKYSSRYASASSKESTHVGSKHRRPAHKRCSANRIFPCHSTWRTALSSKSGCSLARVSLIAWRSLAFSSLWLSVSHWAWTWSKGCSTLSAISSAVSRMHFATFGYSSRILVLMSRRVFFFFSLIAATHVWYSFCDLICSVCFGQFCFRTMMNSPRCWSNLFNVSLNRRRCSVNLGV